MNPGLKQRLTGLLVLLLGALILWPLVFDDPYSRQVSLETEIPPAPDVDTVAIELAEPTRDDAPLETGPHAVMPETPDTPETSTPEAASAETPTSAEAADAGTETAPARERPAEEALGLDERGLPRGWVVQVGAFEDVSRARALRDSLSEESLTAYIHEGASEQGTLYRVYVGPKISRAEADALKARLDKLLGYATFVVDFNP